ncbi:MAG: endonuclease/exonuclease/phosphatase family protein [Thiothrix sp.]|nr:endonuclease/exonuclease/phosphatase family protein [Thiothrix sp.]
MILILILFLLLFTGRSQAEETHLSNREDSIPERTGQLRIATFNAWLNREAPGQLRQDLAGTDQPQIRKVAEIIQRVQPDILLLNEFDYVADGSALRLLQANYLTRSQNGATPIQFPHTFIAPSNTGLPSGFDLDRDGKASDINGDALGFGAFPGQYGMALLSRFPVETRKVRTFQTFLWKDMPGALLPLDPDSGKSWYRPEELAIFRLSSKSHWDLPLQIAGRTLHVLASHPTPPVFDGPEDRNGRRNHDEIRFWHDYINPDQAGYIYDDHKLRGGLPAQQPFVILGDMNASPHEGDATGNPMGKLLQNDRIQGRFTPESEGARQYSPGNPYGPSQTASWRLRADYVLPSRTGLRIEAGAVVWPASDDPLYHLVGPELKSSDHRLVWLDLSFEK